MIANYKERVKNLFTKKPNYKELYEEERKMAEGFEFKYNKLRRQLKSIIKECDQ
jgi:hypothetical protein